LWDWDIVNGKLAWCGAHERLAGMVPGAFSGKIDAFSDILHPDDRASVWNKVQASMEAQQEHFSDEYRFVHPDGSVHWMRARGRFFYDEAGRAVRMTGVVQNISDRKQMEMSFAAAKEQLDATLAAGDIGLWHWNLSNDKLFTNRNLRKLFALDGSDDMPVEVFTQRVHADDRERIQSAIGRTVQQCDRYDEQFRVQWPDGTIRWIHSRGKVECDEPGKPRSFSGVVLDITARKLAEERLRAAHDTFRYLVEQSPFGLYTVDEDFRLAQVSAGAQKVFENVRPLLGRDFAEVLRLIWPEPFAGEALARFRHTLDTGEPYQAPSTVEQRRDIDELETYDWKIEGIRLPDGRWGVVCHFYDLSERQKFEEALRESALFYRQTLESIPGMAFTNQPDGSCDYVSQQWVDFTGIPAFEQLGSGWVQALHPDDRERAFAAWRAAVEGRGQYDLEYRVRCHDGRYTWFKVRGRAIRDDDGTVIRWFGTAVNIDDLKQTERARLESDERLRIATETAEVGIWEWNVKTNQVRWDNRMFDIYGVPRTPDGFVSYQTWQEAVLPEDLAEQERVLGETVRRRSRSAREFRIHRCNDGAERWIEAIETVRLDEAGNTEWVIGTNSDVTDRKHADQALRESEERLRLALEGADLGSWDVDIKTGQTTWNRRHALMQGYQPDDGPVSMELWQKLVHSDDLDRVMMTLEQAQRERGPFAEEHRFRRADTGELRWMSLYGRFLYDETGEPVRFSGVSLDITERKQAEAAVQRRTQQLDLLARTSQRLVLTDKPQELLEDIFNDIARLIDMETFYHHLLADEPGLLRLQISGGAGRQEQDLFGSMSFGELLCGRVAESRRTLIVEDLRTPIILS
jgi:PAS domain S-box-containing protein